MTTKLKYENILLGQSNEKISFLSSFVKYCSHAYEDVSRSFWTELITK